MRLAIRYLLVVSGDDLLIYRSFRDDLKFSMGEEGDFDFKDIFRKGF